MIKIDFRGFWEGFNYLHNDFFGYLIKEGLVEINNVSPDIIFYSDYINDSDVNTTKPRVLYSPENIPRKNYLFKYHMNYEKGNKNNFRFQNFFYYPFFYEVTNNKESEYYLTLKKRVKTKNINFIYSNGNALLRNRYYDFLSSYYKIDSFGRYKNNMGELPASPDKSLYSRAIQKSELISEYKFTIAFENSKGVDYISEKIWEPISVNSIPIYYGSEAVFDYFNKDKLIYISSDKDFSKSLSMIREINLSEKLYKEYLDQDIFINDDVKESLKYKNLSARFIQYLEKIIQDGVDIDYKLLKRFQYAVRKINKKYGY